MNQFCQLSFIILIVISRLIVVFLNQYGLLSKFTQREKFIQFTWLGKPSVKALSEGTENIEKKGGGGSNAENLTAVNL